MKSYKRLEQYGIIGNLETCALVADDGSIDWCCFPHIESASIFARILDSDKGGHFAISPQKPFRSKQAYIEKTNVLKSLFQTSSGKATLIDFMPLEERSKGDKIRHRAIYRKITCDEGSMELKFCFKPRFDYARTKTTLELTEKRILAKGYNEEVFLNIDNPVSLQIKNSEALGTYPIREGDVFWIVLQYGFAAPLGVAVYENLLEKTIQYWTDWSHNCEPSKCVFDGPWHDLVTRSGLTLKLLTHQETGAICAALTTSLPEEIGGIRNWDYRFNWIRDASFTVQALHNLGHVEEARKLLKWFMSICKETKEPSEIQIIYGLHGERNLEEQELKHLSGYRNSRPVRIGNNAVKQKQLDIYGELINAIYETTRYGEDLSLDLWHFVKKIIDYVSKVWNTRDAGIWEVRSDYQHFVYSKLMCWVAFDRGIKIAKLRNFEAPFKSWEATKDKIKDAILKKGFSYKLNSFVQSFDSETLDATSLLIPMLGFLPFKDPRVQGTIDATLRELTDKKGFVYRYRGEDGLSGTEGAFILCSFWLVDVLALSGRVEEAEKIFKNILNHISPLGLFPEEINPEGGELLGNFPQAFSHIGLINSALYLGKARRRRLVGPEPLGLEE